ncbi:MAG: PD-(D/E)XK nuclease family protein [Lachnospiraceae bacterium]|jgi:ATP-dependent helicase/nuclease subunit B
MSVYFYYADGGRHPEVPVRNRIFEESRRNPDKTYYILVPEQSTLQAERAWMTASPGHVLANVQVVSFTGLAYSVLDERETAAGTLLDDTGKSMIIGRILREKKEELPTFAREQGKAGFTLQLSRAVDELMLSCAEPGVLGKIAADTDLPEALRSKLADINTVLSEFQRELGTRYSTAETLLEKLTALIPQSSLFGCCELVVMGFTSFRESQMRAIEQLMLRASDTTVIGTCRTPGSRLDTDHFPMFSQTLSQVRGLAKKYGFAFVCREPEGTPERRVPDEFRRMERSLFLPNSIPWPDPPKCVQAVRASDPEEEVRFTAADIRRLVREKKCRYSEIGLVIGDSDDYRNLLSRVFSRAGIPLYLDEKRRLRENPIAGYISAVMQAMTEDFSYASVMCVLRSPLCPISPEKADLLDNYLVASGIRGRSAYEREWQLHYAKITDERLAEVNEVRAEICGLFRPLWAVFIPGAVRESNGKDGQAQAGQESDLTAGTENAGERQPKNMPTVRDGCEALVYFLEECGSAQKMEALREKFAEEGDTVRESEYRQAYESVMKLLDQMAGLMGDDPLDIGLFADTLNNGFEALKVGTVPVTFDRVVAADLERSRLQDVKALYFLGVNDGVLPAGHDSGSILTDADREALKKEGISLLPTAAETEFNLEEYLYLMISRASDRISFSYVVRGRDGREIRPSWLMREIRRIFPKLEIREAAAALPAADRLISAEEGVRLLVSELNRYAAELSKNPDQGENQAGNRNDSAAQKAAVSEENQADTAGSADWRSLVRWFKRNDPELLKKVIDGLTYSWHPDKLSKETAGAIFHRDGEISVTGLEDYAACPYRHFLRSGLKLSERAQPTVRAADLGTVFHESLSAFFSTLKQKSMNFSDLSEEELGNLAEDSVKKAVQKLENPVFTASSRGQYTVTRAVRMIRRTLWALQSQWKSGDYRKTYTEFTFSREKNSSIKITLPDSSEADLAGRVDRTDIAETADASYVKVIDYKSGKVSFDAGEVYYGLALQILLYLDAMTQLEQSLNPDRTVIPAGAYYYTLQDPVVDEGSGEDVQRLKDLTMTGVTGSEEDVRSRIDRNCSGMVVKGLEMKKGGKLKAGAKVADRNQMRWLISFAKKKAAELAESMFEGKIGADPEIYNRQSACEFCAMREICDFEPGTDGCQFRQLETLSLDDLWKRKESEEDGGQMDGRSE